MYVYMQPGLLGQAHAGIYAGLLVDASRMYRARENHRAGRSIALRSTGHCMLSSCLAVAAVAIIWADGRIDAPAGKQANGTARHGCRSVNRKELTRIDAR
jgi:hypothetical protein